MQQEWKKRSAEDASVEDAYGREIAKHQRVSENPSPVIEDGLVLYNMHRRICFRGGSARKEQTNSLVDMPSVQWQPGNSIRSTKESSVSEILALICLAKLLLRTLNNYEEAWKKMTNGDALA